MKKTKNEKWVARLKKNLKAKKGSHVMVRLPESMSASLEMYSNRVDEPIKDFRIIDYVKRGKNDFFIGESLKEINGKKVRVAFSKHCLKYLTGETVKGRKNKGYSLDEYLPEDGTIIILTQKINPSYIIPGIFGIEPVNENINKRNIIVFKCVVRYINGNGYAETEDYTKGPNKATWKDVYGSNEYMTNFECHYSETIKHKKLVLESVEILAQYLESQGANNHARRLRYRGITHDNSKLGYTGMLSELSEYERREKKKSYDKEVFAMSRIAKSQSSMAEIGKTPDPENKKLVEKALKLHWKNNSHHPEHYESVLDMSRLDIMEMCCDWHARSIQLGTDLMAYVDYAQESRFHFPEYMLQEIKEYCRILVAGRRRKNEGE